MEVTVAKYAGFCGGVKRAIKLARETAAQGPVYMLGDIVHNKIVVDELAELGIKVVHSIEEIPASANVLFRAHGTEKETREQAESAKLEIIDATCPLVTEIHETACNLADEGRQLIIIGDHGHDEVIAIASQVEDAVILKDAAEAKTVTPKKKIGIVTQSTQNIENVQEIIRCLSAKTSDLRFVNTICAPTRNRQTEIQELAKTNDMVLVIGSETSANSKRLTSISKALNEKTFQINSVQEIDSEWFSGVQKVAIAAGASTPDTAIKEVEKFVKNIKIT